MILTLLIYFINVKKVNDGPSVWTPLRTFNMLHFSLLLYLNKSLIFIQYIYHNTEGFRRFFFKKASVRRNVFFVRKSIYYESLFNVLYIEIKLKCKEISFGQNERWKKCIYFASSSSQQFTFNDTHREKSLSNKTATLAKSMNMDIWVVGTPKQLFVRGKNFENFFSRK